MIGNNYHSDIQGAHARGLATIWFRWNTRSPAPTTPSAATYVAASTAEVHAAINHWIGSGFSAFPTAQ